MPGRVPRPNSVAAPGPRLRALSHRPDRLRVLGSSVAATGSGAVRAIRHAVTEAVAVTSEHAAAAVTMAPAESCAKPTITVVSSTMPPSTTAETTCERRATPSSSARFTSASSAPTLVKTQPSAPRSKPPGVAYFSPNATPISGSRPTPAIATPSTPIPPVSASDTSSARRRSTGRASRGYASIATKLGAKNAARASNAPVLYRPRSPSVR